LFHVPTHLKNSEFIKVLMNLLQEFNFYNIREFFSWANPALY
jgi:hypothetical protein